MKKLPPPYYQDEYTTLYIGDAIELVHLFKSDSFDAVITDPPYSSGSAQWNTKALPTSQKYLSKNKDCPFPDFEGDNKDQRAFAFWCHLWLTQAFRIVKKGGVVCQFTDWRQLPLCTDVVQSAGWTWRGIHVWNKLNSRPQKGRFKNQCEYLVWASKGVMSKDGPCLSGCVSQGIVLGKKRRHQTQKPVELMQEICQLAWQKDALILDPFAGSGSTLVAAKSLGKRAVGIELNEAYAQATVERLKKISYGEYQS